MVRENNNSCKTRLSVAASAQSIQAKLFSQYIYAKIKEPMLSATTRLSSSLFYMDVACCIFIAGLIDIAVGGSPHVIALTADGAMFGWGYNGNGEAGLNHTNSPVLAPTPIQLNMAGIRITKVSCGCDHTLALSETGQVRNIPTAAYVVMI